MDARGLRGGWASFQRHSSVPPSPDLAPFVDHYWIARWDLRGQPPYRQLLPPTVGVHLSFVGEEAGEVRGPLRRFHHRTLAGEGRALGVAFRPGGFRPYLGGPVSAIADRSVPMDAVFDRAVVLPSALADEQLVDEVEQVLRADRPPVDPAGREASAAVDVIAADPALTRVDALASRLGVGVRSLQRLFAEYVGVGPKWCIRRYRLLEVTSRLADGAAVDWAALAAELGYADQAHFSRDFTAILGEPPSRYALRY
ncbi:AraC family transcriptional regulator [Cryptosporangium phraense]|uniref:AraC family transcriptional regulator n=1 Tax=Cryptosporangium phraense TaxID=2593070 RepID=A0A545AW84_9ACTN|nr:helix-turn-helix domain-containing protein [Cryptosporangium phraense]TQS45580.1 AraC family transcriptional regulator [Cryptosporangium phraense]